MTVTADELGTQDIKKLLIKQAVPSSIGILFMSVNILIDTIFVGQWIGSLAIAAVTVVLPITFLISSLGMAIGVGGGSVLSRALGSNHKEKALYTFGNQIMMTFLLSSIFVFYKIVIYLIQLPATFAVHKSPSTIQLFLSQYTDYVTLLRHSIML